MKLVFFGEKGVSCILRRKCDANGLALLDGVAEIGLVRLHFLGQFGKFEFYGNNFFAGGQARQLGEKNKLGGTYRAGDLIVVAVARQCGTGLALTDGYFHLHRADEPFVVCQAFQGCVQVGTAKGGKNGLPVSWCYPSPGVAQQMPFR